MFYRSSSIALIYIDWQAWEKKQVAEVFTQYVLDGTGALAWAGEESRGQAAGGGGWTRRNHTVTGGTKGTTGVGGHLMEREGRVIYYLRITIREIEWALSLCIYIQQRFPIVNTAEK